MGQGPTSEDDSRFSNQEISRILWNSMVAVFTKPATGAYPEPVESIPHPQSLIFKMNYDKIPLSGLFYSAVTGLVVKRGIGDPPVEPQGHVVRQIIGYQSRYMLWS